MTRTAVARGSESHHGITLAVMARAPVPGFCKTRLARDAGNEAAAALYRAMLLDTMAAYDQLPVARRVLLAAPEHDGVRILRELAREKWEVVAQRGEDLGQRLTVAQAALRPGGVILTGSDSPLPPLPALREALATWPHDGRVLIGPNPDGGYYLIALPLPEERLFQDIDWSTSSVLGQTLARCHACGLPLHLLPPATDVDVVEDVDRLRDELRATPARAHHTRAALEQWLL